jgi:hypothetical protein
VLNARTDQPVNPSRYAERVAQESKETCGMTEYISIHISNDEDGESANISTDFGEQGLKSWEDTPAGSVVAAIFNALKDEGAIQTEEE